MAKDKIGTVIDAIQRDHREVEEMLEAVTSASGDARRDAFEKLAAKLKAHEAAEQQVVHPLTAEEGGADEARALQDEESAAARAIKKLEGLDVDSAEFEKSFASFKADVLAHAQEEERDEHPQLLRETPTDELERRKDQFEKAEREAAGR
jgi:iron-sulfur cluster repair protein YtfE (RIC family)